MTDSEPRTDLHHQAPTLSFPGHAAAGDAHGLTIRCPLCRHPFRIVVDADLSSVTCEVCGNNFSLSGDSNENNSATIARIAQFELIERLGMGGFGTVWKARDGQLGRIVALKIPRKGLLDAKDLDSFLHEARVAAQLSHPNIVNVFEIGRDGDTAYIASELMEGKSLADWSKDHPLTHQQTASLFVKICRALHHAHQCGVVHRDLKPGNVLMDEVGEPHLTDFGLAKREAADVTMTMDGRVLGTPAYMPPEQAAGSTSTTDRRSDVYSLGVMLFQLLTGELPFRGNVRLLIHHAMHTEPPSPRTLNAAIPLDLETICLRCLEKEPKRRYQTAAELADELQRFEKGEPILSRPISSAARAWRWCRRHPVVPGLLGVLAVVLSVVYVVGWLWFRAAYARLDKELTTRALTSNLFTANLVADAAGRDFEKRFATVAAAAKDDELIAALRPLVKHAEWPARFVQLNDVAQQENQLSPLRAKLLAEPLRKPVDDWVRQRQSLAHQSAFAWFVLGPDGLQIARAPEEDGETIGRNYAWRSYYLREPQDRPETWRVAAGEIDNWRLTGTKLSSVFVSQFTNQWVVVVSAPILDGEEFLGVVGMMVELGKLVQLPGHERDTPTVAPRQRFATLVDSRAANRGQLLEHPLYVALSGTERRELLDLSQQPDHRVPLDDWRTNDNYRDPFGQEYREFGARWLAARLPVRVLDDHSGLEVIVQESYAEVIGTALDDLGRTVVYLSVATLALAGFIVTLILYFLRRVLIT